MKAFLVIEHYSPMLESMSGSRCTLFLTKELAQKRYGVYRRNEDVRILEIEIPEREYNVDR